VQSPRHIRLLVRRKPPGPHHRLRRRLAEAVVLVGIVNVLGTLAMWLLEDDEPSGQIDNLWDAFFFTTVQLLTVSSQMPNPVTTGGRIVDIFLQMTAICLVAGIAGTFASFFLELESSDQGH
jgi:hypothetical protein